MFHFSFLRGMSVPRFPLTHIPNNYYYYSNQQQLFSNACSVPIPTTIPKLALPACSVLPIQQLQISVVHDTEQQHNVVLISNFEHDSLDEKVVRERMRRMRIGLANKGRVPWNKGREHTAETRERIKMRTIQALRDPKVKKKMVGRPHCHSDQTKEKISYSQRRLWQKRLKSKRVREQFFLLWEQNIANAAKKGGTGQEELDWDSYDRIKEQLVFHLILQAEEKEKEKLMAIAGAKKFIQSWTENIAKAAKIGGSGEQELDWDSYEKIKEEMILLNQLQRTTEKVKAKEMANIKVEKEALIKAIKKITLTKKRKYLRERKKDRKSIKSQRYKNAEEDKCAIEVTQEFQLVSKLTENHASNNIGSELDLELIRREKMLKKVSLADQIQAAKLIKGKLHL
ncbi:uncharacterized protein LOC123881644 [Trifolium pratense]|uniref:uncharacterized protein LOC123881644 n=1 Tax=Trifolium pratense TaxID=57577 RepID=UPI001E695F45|nr:uncharacterized protein LOC123881644 [Trifolium pratense]